MSIKERVKGRGVAVKAKMKRSMLFALVVLVLIYNNQNHAVGFFEGETTALLEIRAFLDAQALDSDDIPNWFGGKGSNCCKWERVTCDPITNRVSMISLRSVLSSTFGHFNMTLLCPFKNLRSLDLSGNRFADLSTNDDVGVKCLSMLEKLDLSYNAFNNTIFKALRIFTSLQHLNISINDLEGSLSTQEFPVFKNLKTLDLSHNRLTLLPGICVMTRLLELHLNRNKIQGGLPPCLGRLISLQVLDLSSNQLGGNISASIFASMISLEYLALSRNFFGGLFMLNLLANHSRLKVLMLAMYGNKFQVETESVPWVPSFQLRVLHMPNCSINSHKRTIPNFLLYQHALEDIDISWNQLVGEFPNWLVLNNSQLQVIRMASNSFTGVFKLSTDPNKHMFNLTILDISRNKLEGQIPQNIGHLFPNPTAIYMSHNLFQGVIPSSFGEMSRLTRLDLDNNNFSGQIPRQLVSNCTSLHVLRLSNNNLHGHVFSSFWNLTQLWILSLRNNYLTGNVQLPKINGLQSLDISENQFLGTLPSSLAKMSLVIMVSMSWNNFEGKIPEEWCKLHELEYINLSQNRLSGSIPSCFHQTSLKFIHLQRNNLVGIIPKEFSSLYDLVTLDLRRNNLSGNVPQWINQLVNLKVLLLAGNHFGEKLPLQLCQLKNLTFLDLSNNSFIGPLPPCLNNITSGIHSKSLTSSTFAMCLCFDDNGLAYYDCDCQNPFEIVEFTTKGITLPYEGKILDYMSGLDFSSNYFSGHIPEELGNLIPIYSLNLSRNNFNGSIPTSISKLQNLESLDLSYNNLSGEIPFQLVKLKFLAIFNVSYNNLSGVTPSEGQFGVFDESCYIGNPDLHWSVVNKGPVTSSIAPPSSDKSEDDDDGVLDMVAFYSSFGASYVTVLTIIAAILCINPYWRAVWFYYIGKCVDTYFYWV